MALYTVMTWGIGLPLIHYVGFVGIAITVCAITYLTFPLVLWALKRVVDVDTFGTTWRPLLASLLMGLAVYFLRLRFVHSLSTLFATIIFGLVCYMGLLLLIDRKYLRIEITNLWHALVARS
jgi:O-antigen/teichoic acid export membrane protein